MYLTGDYVEPSESFNTEFCGPRTEIFMEYISNDLAEKHWDGIFRALAAVSKHVAQEVTEETAAFRTERAPLPASDPPSPPPMSQEV